MSKFRPKKTKKNQSKIKIPPATLLRSKLDLLWQNLDNVEKNQENFEQELNNAVKNIKPSFFIPVIVKVYLASSSNNQTKLNQILPSWLNSGNYLETLKQLILNCEFDEIEQKIAINWFSQEEKEDISALIKAQENTFYRAYIYEDDLGSQGVLALFWYSNRQKSRVRGINFLIDYNPPWDGSIKDIMYFPAKNPKDAIRELIDFWRTMGDNDDEMIPLEASEAKTKILLSLLCNQNKNIRLPRDLIACSEEFERNVLTLPDEEKTPPFTMSDFDTLSNKGQTPEEIMDFEQNMGRRIRLDSGNEIFMLNSEVLFGEE